MKIKNNRKGFTLAEMLMTVAIILILAGVSFVGVISYLRHLKQLENDGIAKEIFIAAQNHLSMASSQGFLGRDKFGTEEDKEKGINYFIVNGIDNSDDSVLNLMLPFASIDETVRNGGSYIIRYQKNPAIVKDVFYASKTGRFNHTFDSGEYINLIDSFTGDDKKSARRSYGNDNSVIGYYGGAGLNESVLTLKLPTIKVTNAERLQVDITNPDDNLIDLATNGVQLKLIITGLNTGYRKSIPLITSNGNYNYLDSTASKQGTKFTVVLDDITEANNQFAYLFRKGSSFEGDVNEALIPGEDIEIKAVAFSNKVLANIAESAVSKTNSIFGDGTEAISNGTAIISNIRHLENLSKNISNVNYSFNNDTDSTKSYNYITEKQTADLSWIDFQIKVNELKNKTGSATVTTTITPEESSGTEVSGVQIYPMMGTASTSGKFIPVTTEIALNYRGQGNKISGITVETSENAGLFGTLVFDSTVSDLELVDFDIKSTDNSAGALAGIANKSTIKNVLAHNELQDDSVLTISGKGNTGGLVGTMAEGGSITASAAAVYVKSTNGPAGGLVGSASGGSIISSYSGGHTDGESGMYTTNDSGKGRINVIAGSGTAGGLVGTVSNGTITHCYSTCSVSGTTEGGFAGSVTSSNISNSYATGLVKWSKPSNESGSTSGGSSTSSLDTIGAFIGTGSAGGNNNHYFDLMNDGLKAVAGKDSEQVNAIDNNLADYQVFFDRGGTAVAYPYDNRLMLENRGKYYYLSVEELGGTLTKNNSNDPDYFVQSHYGDWCSPETLVINTGTNSQSSGSGD